MFAFAEVPRFNVRAFAFIANSAKVMLVAVHCVSYLANDSALDRAPVDQFHNRWHLIRHQPTQRKSVSKIL